MHLFTKLVKLLPIETAHAHCDIPCGIYDPHIAQLSAHTAIRMIRLIHELPKLTPDSSPEERRDPAVI